MTWPTSCGSAAASSTFPSNKCHNQALRVGSAIVCVNSLRTERACVKIIARSADFPCVCKEDASRVSLASLLFARNRHLQIQIDKD